MNTRLALIFAGVFGLLAVVAGTFGAHVFEGRIAEDLLATYEVGVRYHMFHALAILAAAGFVDRPGKGASAAVWCWSAGIVVFAGSLYALALSGQRWWGMVTPIGGGFFLAGWVAVIVAGVRAARR